MKRVAAFSAVVAAHTLIASSWAHAQSLNAALFVAPEIRPVAAPAGTPPAIAAVATPAARPAPSDQIRPAPVTPQAATAPACNVQSQFVRFDRPLVHTMRQLASGQPLTIVAIGSSSTAGAGASSPAASYPSRLADELRARFPGRDITVLNRGINGEETDNMIARFDTDVIAPHPQLVLWQVGTNSVLRDRPLGPHASRLREGVERLKAAGADIVLIDPQFSPAVIAKPETEGMVDQIAVMAKEENVDLFHRFAAMRAWNEAQHLDFDVFVSPDHLHMNDWGYACWAKLIGTAIGEAATRPIAAASVHPAPAK